ncbi:MAG TPA: hypothetical protein VGP31_00950 [Planosporangium sp.]|nr:hypothetical protein [Planosporangium sp.]
MRTHDDVAGEVRPVRATRTSRAVTESVTPRIDSERWCRCGATVVWDEVYGWLHAPGGVRSCRLPHPRAG